MSCRERVNDTPNNVGDIMITRANLSKELKVVKWCNLTDVSFGRVYESGANCFSGCSLNRRNRFR